MKTRGALISCPQDARLLLFVSPDRERNGIKRCRNAHFSARKRRGERG